MIWNVPGIVIQAPSRLRPRRRLLVTHWPGPGPHCSDSELARADRLRYRSRVPRPVRRAAVSEPESGCQPECQARAAALRGTTRLARGLPILTDPPVRSERRVASDARARLWIEFPADGKRWSECVERDYKIVQKTFRK